MKVTLFHSEYGCDSGCCGHTIKFGDNEQFSFSHPHGREFEQWARDIVEKTFPGHSADLDFANCAISDC